MNVPVLLPLSGEHLHDRSLASHVNLTSGRVLFSVGREPKFPKEDSNELLPLMEITSFDINRKFPRRVTPDSPRVSPIIKPIKIRIEVAPCIFGSVHPTLAVLFFFLFSSCLSKCHQKELVKSERSFDSQSWLNSRRRSKKDLQEFLCLTIVFSVISVAFPSLNTYTSARLPLV
jgi:hypothetical protein